MAGSRTACRISGSHHAMRHPDGRTVLAPIPRGRDMPRGRLRNILAIIGMTPYEFRALLCFRAWAQFFQVRRLRNPPYTRPPGEHQAHTLAARSAHGGDAADVRPRTTDIDRNFD